MYVMPRSWFGAGTSPGERAQGRSRIASFFACAKILGDFFEKKSLKKLSRAKLVKGAAPLTMRFAAKTKSISPDLN